MEKDTFDQRDMTILIVDDEPRIRDLVRMNLELEHYSVIEASNGQEALEQLREHLPDLVILDVMMPGMEGFETLRALREVSTVPVMMLTVRQSEQDKIHGLDLGADDYLAKPFNPRELLSRTRALLRRSFMPTPSRKTEIVVDQDLKIDFARREVIVRGQKVVLRPTEYRLLYHLVSNAGRLLTHETLLSKVWGHEYRDEAHYLRLYIAYLRHKIEKDPTHPKYIFTERGVGYRFKALDV
ncbi:MAG: response regulator transcription factor [Ktedonobacteraceae bacterium]|nr:response regulator transcription factor [Ktedonobacteraceae bacterium]